MSSARLEVINDDPTVAPRMSRSLPAALYGIVNVADYEAFCNKLDELFDALDSEYRRRKKRFWWMYGGIYAWFMYFIVFAQIFDYQYTMLSFFLCAIHISTVLMCTARPTGVKPDKETMRDIRTECEAMTNRTPYVSFHVVLMSTPAAARGAWLQMNTIDHIGVSIAGNATAAVSASAGAVNSIMVDTHDTKSDDAAGSPEPVVYAQAVLNGKYQSVPSSNDVDIV